MIWKIVVGILGVGLLIVLGFFYVPDLRRDGKKKEAVNTTLIDSIQADKARILALEGSLKDKLVQLEGIGDAYRRWQDRTASIQPNVTLQIQGLTAQAQRLANIEALIRAGLLKPSDTTAHGPGVTYSQQTNTAMTIALRLRDSLEVYDSVLIKEHASLQYAYKRRGDSLGTILNFTNTNLSIANQNGLFSGRNRRLRRRNQNPPY